MGVEEHRHAAAEIEAAVRIIVVSSSRSLEDDRSGELIARLLKGAGHGVLGRELVDDDPVEIAEAVRRAAGDARVDALVLTGGTGLSARDLTPEALRPLLDREIEGFGELFRMLSFQEVGAAAMLSRALAGIVGTMPVFALPGSRAACRLAVESLILPELAHLLHQARKEPPPSAGRPASTPSEADASRPHNLLDLAMSEQPAGRAAGQDRALAWLESLESLGAIVHRDRRGALPPAVEAHAPVMQVLAQAGTWAELELPGARRYALLGFPNLDAPSSKVLAIGPGQPVPEIVALHRHPTPTGTCVAALTALLPYRHEIESTCERVTGKAAPGGAEAVLAVEGDKVYLERGGRVASWDGRRERDEGRPRQVLASLVLRWSRR